MSSEGIVAKFLENYGLVCERFTDAEMSVSKTPDFKVFKNDKLKLYCEVKHANKDRFIDSLLEDFPEEEFVGGIRKDPIFNRLAKHVHTAAKQLSTVNPDEEFANVMVFFNSDENSGFFDLIAITTGNFYAEGGAVFPIYKKYSEGRIKVDIEKIHLFIWLDEHHDHRFLFNTFNDKYQEYLCEIFGFESQKLKLVHM